MCLSGRKRITPKIDLIILNFMTEHHTDTRNTWYALRTFHRLEEKVSLFLEEKHLQHFIPMAYSAERAKPKKGEKEAPDPMKPVLVPAIHNLLFVQKTGSQKEMLKTLSECTVPVCVFRHPGDSRPCEISEREMMEIRMLCDPHYEQSVFMTQGEAEAMVGKDVRVIAGPFKGAVGRLVRKKKQYYFLKTIIGMGVMVRVSRWCCEPI